MLTVQTSPIIYMYLKAHVHPSGCYNYHKYPYYYTHDIQSMAFVHMAFVRLSVTQAQSFCVKVYKTSYFEDSLMDFIHIWPDGRYRSKVFISTIPTPGVTLWSRSRTWKFHKKVKIFV